MKERAKQEERRQLEMATRRKVLALVLAKWKGPFKKAELAALAHHLYDNGDALTSLEEAYGQDGPNIEKMNEATLGKLIVHLLIGDAAEYEHHNPGLLYDLAKRLKIDPAKVRKEAKAELAGETPKKAGKKK